jgi:hypothetical protein
MGGEHGSKALKIPAIAGKARQAQKRPPRQSAAPISPHIEKQVIVAAIIDVLSVQESFSLG